MNTDVMSVCLIEINEGMTPCSESRPKEVVESIPVQNEAGAQKLLQKMSNTGRDDRYSTCGKHRGKGIKEEAPVQTLDEWEKRKVAANSLMKQEIPNVRQNEDLTRQLQNQFDLEEQHFKSPCII